MNQSPSSADTDRAAWPTAVGLICMIYGFFSVVINLWGALLPWMKGPMARMTETPPPSLPFGLMMLVIVGGVCGALLALILMVGGFKLMQRKRWGVFALKGWVAMKFLEVIIAFGFSYALLDSMVAHQIQTQDYELLILSENAGDVENYPKLTKEEMRDIAFTGSFISAPFVLIWPAVVGLILTRRTHAKEIMSW